MACSVLIFVKATPIIFSRMHVVLLFKYEMCLLLAKLECELRCWNRLSHFYNKCLNKCTMLKGKFYLCIMETRSEFSGCSVPAIQSYFFTTCLEICFSGEGLGTACLRTVVGVSKGMLPVRCF